MILFGNSDYSWNYHGIPTRGIQNYYPAGEVDLAKKSVGDYSYLTRIYFDSQRTYQYYTSNPNFPLFTPPDVIGFQFYVRSSAIADGTYPLYLTGQSPNRITKKAIISLYASSPTFWARIEPTNEFLEAIQGKIVRRDSIGCSYPDVHRFFGGGVKHIFLRLTSISIDLNDLSTGIEDVSFTRFRASGPRVFSIKRSDYSYHGSAKIDEEDRLKLDIDISYRMNGVIYIRINNIEKRMDDYPNLAAATVPCPDDDLMRLNFYGYQPNDPAIQYRTTQRPYMFLRTIPIWDVLKEHPIVESELPDDELILSYERGTLRVRKPTEDWYLGWAD